VSNDVIWDAIRSVHSLMQFVPVGLGGTSRILRCITEVRRVFEQDQFPDASSQTTGEESEGERLLKPIPYPAEEINEAVSAAKPILLRLAERLHLEYVIRDRLLREFKKEEPFLEADDRGTIGAFIEPTGLTQEKSRNNSRLDALAQMLEVIRGDPASVLSEVDVILAKARSQVEGWAIDVIQGRIRWKDTEYENLSPEATLLMRMVVEQPDEWVPMKQLRQQAKSERIPVGSTKIGDIKKSLPNKLASLLESKRGKGTHIKRA
jgi:hypothetical protein